MFAQQVFMEIMKNPKKFGDFKVSRLDLLLQPDNFVWRLRIFQFPDLFQANFFITKNYQKNVRFGFDYELDPAFFISTLGKRTTRRLVRVYSEEKNKKKHFELELKKQATDNFQKPLRTF